MVVISSASPGARESISVAIPFDHLRKRRAVVQKANVSHGKIMTDMMVRRRGLPSVRRLRTSNKRRAVHGVVQMSTARKKK
jgi:hypothetical protein